MESLKEQYEALDSWAVEVERKFSGFVRIKGSSQATLNDCIATATFSLDVDPAVRASDVTDYIHKRGMKYARDARYFFVFDKKKKMLFLLLYAYEVTRKATRYLNEGTDSNNSGRNEA